MGAGIEPYSSGNLSRRASRAIEALDEQQLMCVAGIVADQQVQEVKVEGVYRLVRRGLAGHAFLASQVDQLANGDSVRRDEFRYWENLAAAMVGTIVQDTVADWRHR